MKLVVDANIFISALIGGKAAELLFNPNFELLTTERTTWEVKKYLPELAAHTEKSPADLLFLFELIPVRAYQSKEYETSLSTAQHLIGDRDPFDVDILALTLETGAPLWSNDSDFEGIEKITLLKTKDIIDLVRFFKADRPNKPRK
jgi:predicted nucleic acid-binding protein